MTCAVVLRHARGIALGADTALSYGESLTHGPKIVRRGQVWLACAGSSEAIERFLDRLPAGANPTRLASWVQRRLTSPGCDGIAVCGEQVVEWSAGGVNEVLDYTAVGSGYWSALGAMHALRGVLRASPTAAVLGALRASAAHTTTVRAPFDLVRLTPGRPAVVSRHR